jgi:hypothetical protein
MALAPRAASPSNTEQTRLDAPQTGDGAVAAAYADREARLAADAATMQAGPTEHAANMTGHNQGRPTVETQMHTHTPAPRTPDTGGHDSASDPIC